MPSDLPVLAKRVRPPSDSLVLGATSAISSSATPTLRLQPDVKRLSGMRIDIVPAPAVRPALQSSYRR